jgi:hypothetical protein
MAEESACQTAAHGYRRSQHAHSEKENAMTADDINQATTMAYEVLRRLRHCQAHSERIRP